ncbi:hypothetical protein LEP3755_56620 [Leptolyngbya sp. NIES-3755]|nr:hypothetical protein LEP3755_56620 [Leptolyngbya sp. NIES-3755]
MILPRSNLLRLRSRNQLKISYIPRNPGTLSLLAPASDFLSLNYLAYFAPSEGNLLWQRFL